MYRNGFYRHRIVAVVTIVLILGVFLTRLPQTKAQFIIASWSFPDEYGQGIDGIRFYENSTGSWLDAPYYLDGGVFYYLHYYQTGYTLNWSSGVGIKLRVYTVFNSTLTGAIDEADGQNYQRHNVVVRSGGITIFSQQNFTYYDVESVTEMWWYKYDVILGFIPADGQIYTVAVTYEIYF